MTASKTPDAEILDQARAAGLEKAVELFPADVLDAAKSAARARNTCPVLDDITAEPWPPMVLRRGA